MVVNNGKSRGKVDDWNDGGKEAWGGELSGRDGRTKSGLGKVRCMYVTYVTGLKADLRYLFCSPGGKAGTFLIPDFEFEWLTCTMWV